MDEVDKAGTLGRIVFANWRSETFPARATGARPAQRQAEGHCGHRQFGAHGHLPPTGPPRRHLLRPRARLLRIPDQQAPPRSRSGCPTAGIHRTAHLNPRRQSHHRRRRRLTSKPHPHNKTRLRRVAFGLPTHHPIFGQTGRGPVFVGTVTRYRGVLGSVSADRAIRDGLRDVGDGNIIYGEVCGNPERRPVLAVDNCPGSGGVPLRIGVTETPDRHHLSRASGIQGLVFGRALTGLAIR
jgi:hypothetical protein